MTTIETLTVQQVVDLGTEAAQANDAATITDCALLLKAYNDSACSELSAMIDEERGEIREAARRIVAVIRNAEAQS